MYQNCLRQQPHTTPYMTGPSGTATPSPLLYDRGAYCYPRNSPPNPTQSTAVYQGTIYTQPNGHLAELTAPDCLGARKPPLHPAGGGLTLSDGSPDPGSTSPIGTVYWTHYQRGAYPVAPPAASPPTTYYDPNRRVMSPGGGVQWAANDVQFSGHPAVNDGQSGVEGYTTYRASVAGDMNYAKPQTAAGVARGGGGGGGEEMRHQHHQQQQHPSLYPSSASHQKVVSSESRSGPSYHRSTPASGGHRVSTGGGSSTPGVAGGQGHAAPPFDWMRKHAYPAVPNSGKTRTKDKYRIVYTELQKVELEKEFLYNQYITIQRKAELAVAIGLSDRQVKIWFQNRRAKDRKQKRKRSDTNHHHGNHHHQQPTCAAKTSSSSSPSTTAAATTRNNNTSLLSSSPSSSSLSSSSSSSLSSLVLKQEMIGMRSNDDATTAVKVESNYVDTIARPSVANGNGGYDVIPIC